MTEGIRTRRPGRLQLVLIMLAFGGPLLLAAWLYYGGDEWRPGGTTNHGILLEPFTNVHAAATGPEIAGINEGQWLLLYADREACDPDCRDALYTIRQLRLMLGNDMSRLSRVFLHGETPPDRVFLDDRHPGLITISDPGLAALLDSRRPAGAGNGYFLIDPLGNLVMYFPPDLDPGDIVEDLERLLRLSRIG